MESSLRIENPVPWSHVPPFARLLLMMGGLTELLGFTLLTSGIVSIWALASHGVLVASWNCRRLSRNQMLIGNLELLPRLYKEFCKREHLAPVLTKIDIHMFGGPGVKERNSAWNKACVTSNMFLFLEDFCHQNAEKVQQNELLRIFVPVLNACCFELFVHFFVEHVHIVPKCVKEAGGLTMRLVHIYIYANVLRLPGQWR